MSVIYPGNYVARLNAYRDQVLWLSLVLSSTVALVPCA